MAKKDSAYLSELDALVNPRARLGRRAPNQPDTLAATVFERLVIENIETAAEQKETFEAIIELLSQGYPPEPIVRTVEYLIQLQDEEVAQNKKFGEAVAAIASHGHAEEAMTAVETIAKKHKVDTSRNPSLGTALSILMDKDFSLRVGEVVWKLATKSDKSVGALAKNAEAGDIVATLCEEEPDLALRVFIVIAHHKPKSFAANASLDAAMEKIGSLRKTGVFDEGLLREFDRHKGILQEHRDNSAKVIDR